MSTEKKAFDLLAKTTSNLSQTTIKTMAEHGKTSRLSAIFVCLGAMVGTAQVTASLICPDNTSAPATGINNDSMLFSALLMSRSICTSRDTSNGHAVLVDTVFSPELFALAIEDFRKLTGRGVEGVIDPDYIQCVAEYNAQGNGANDLLRTVCANHKPA